MQQPTRELQVPAAIYKRAEEIAKETNCTTESVLLDGLGMIFSPLPEKVNSADALSDCSDEQLWMMVLQRLTPKQESRWRELADRGNQRELSNRETVELEAWVARVDNQMLLRSRALRLLQHRGHDINRYFETAE